jgi:hypothetical protein
LILELYFHNSLLKWINVKIQFVTGAPAPVATEAMVLGGAFQGLGALGGNRE